MSGQRCAQQRPVEPSPCTLQVSEEDALRQSQERLAMEEFIRRTWNQVKYPNDSPYARPSSPCRQRPEQFYHHKPPPKYKNTSFPSLAIISPTTKAVLEI